MDVSDRGAALELIDGGVFHAVPDLAVVHPHLGGVLPYVAGRISGLGGSKAQHPIEYYLKTHFYADTATSTPAALALAIETYGIDRLVFATDHPFNAMLALRDYLEDNLDPHDADWIYANRVPTCGGRPSPLVGHEPSPSAAPLTSGPTAKDQRRYLT